MAVNEIRYKGASYAVDGDIWAGHSTWYETKSLKCDSLEANSFQVRVSDSDRAITNFSRNDKVEYFRNNQRMGIFYLQSVERVGPDSYTLTALSAAGLLMTMQHAGGIYTGQTAGDVIRDICGNVPVLVESVYESRKIYGWLPYVQPSQASARDNLAEVLFAIGAWLGVDNNGTLRVQKLWDEAASSIGPGLIHADDCVVQYADPISSVEITEHQWMPNTASAVLFEGVAEQGALITFDEPAHDLTASGFAILESGANYAVVSAGTGSLTGQGYTHITQVIRRAVTEGAEDNVVAITDAHLVSLTNSVDVANRVADYYRHRETIQVDINPQSGPPGNLVSIYHPWDKVMVSACIAERETSISGLLKSRIHALVGFVPPQPDTSEYLDERIVLTDAGSVTLPEGAEALRAVLIGEGSPGTAGTAGGANVVTGSTRQNTASATFSAGAAGAGGTGGTGGSGGKILTVTIDLSAGRTFVYDATGADVTFGTYTSADGAASDAGYYDTVTQEYFGRKGADGAAGGRGGAVGYQGESVGDYPGGYGTASLRKTYKYTTGGTTYTGTGSITGFGGGGAAKGSRGRGALGTIQFQGAGLRPDLAVDSQANGVAGADGADGANYGDGGGGGNGGGGAGATGAVSVSISPTPDSSDYSCGWSGVMLSGGAGGQGGQGKAGCIILYYRRPKAVQSGPLVTSDSKWLLDSLGKRMIV